MGDADFLDPPDVRTFAADLDGSCGGDRHRLMLRPDDVCFTIADDATPPERVARIVHGEFRGSTWCYTLQLPSGVTIRALRSHLEPVEVGAAVTPGIKPDHHPVFVPA
jgi:hypothetical protein